MNSLTGGVAPDVIPIHVQEYVYSSSKIYSLIVKCESTSFNIIPGNFVFFMFVNATLSPIPNLPTKTLLFVLHCKVSLF